MKMTLVCLLAFISVSQAWSRGRTVEPRRVEPRATAVKPITEAVYADPFRGADVDAVAVEITNCRRACPTAEILADLLIQPERAQLAASEIALVNSLAKRTADMVAGGMANEVAVVRALREKNLDPAAFKSVCKL